MEHKKTDSEVLAESIMESSRDDDASIILVYLAFMVYGGVLGFLAGLCF